MKKGKKILAAVFSAVCLSAFTLGLIACGEQKVDIQTLEPKVTYYVGDNLHVFDLFEKEEGVEYSFTVSKNGEKAEDVEGTAFFLKETGVYTITCKAGASKKSVEVNVFESGSFMLLKNMTATVDLNRKMLDRQVIALAEAVVICDVYHEEYIESVKIFDGENGESRTVQITADEPTEDSFYDGVRFNFKYECDYVFTIVSSTGEAKTYGELTVTAKENFSEIEHLTQYEVAYDDATKTVSWDEVDGAAKYRVKVDLKNAYTTETELAIDDYLVSDFQFFDLYVLPEDAEGNTIGKMIVEDVVIAPEGSEGVVKGVGSNIDVENKTVTLIGTQTYTASATDIAKSEIAHIGYGGKYGVGTYVEFTFTGNNMPQVMFFASEINGNLTSGGGTGYILMNGLYASNRGTSTSKSSVIGEHRLICVGPDRLRPGNQKDPLHNYIACSEHSNAYLVSENSLFTQQALNADSTGREYRYVAGSFNKGGMLAFEVKLYDNSNDELLERAIYITTEKVEDVEAGHIVAYTTIKGNGNDTTFGYGLPYYVEPDPFDIYSLGAVKNEDGSVTLEAEKYVGNYTSQMTTAFGITGVNSSNADISYVGLKGEYGVGYYVTTKFVGYNLPNVMFFADEINADLTSEGGKGLLLCGEIQSNALRGANRLGVYGPNRIPALYDSEKGLTAAGAQATYGYVYSESDTHISLGKFTETYLTAAGLKEDATGREYTYTAGTYLNKAGYIVVHVTLTAPAAGDLEAVNYDLTVTTSLTEADVTAGNIVLYGAIKDSSLETRTTTFTYDQPFYQEIELPDEGPSIITKDATLNDDGSYTLAYDAYNGNYTSTMTDALGVGGSTSGSSGVSHVGLQGKYGIGTYVTTKFVGYNIPNVMFFADEINGDLTSCGGKGLLLCGEVQSATLRGANRMSVYGPNRIKAVYDENSGLTDEGVTSTKWGYVYSDNDSVLSLGRFTETYLSAAGLKEDTTGREYTYTVGTYLNGEGKLVVHILLTAEAAGGLEAVNYDVTLATTLTESDVTAGSIVLYGAIKDKSLATRTTTFTFVNIEQKQEA